MRVSHRLSLASSGTRWVGRFSVLAFIVHSVNNSKLEDGQELAYKWDMVSGLASCMLYYSSLRGILLICGYARVGRM